MGFVQPVALSFAALYGVLVLFYLWERWRRQVSVPSLLLWETVREDIIRARRFRPDLLFVLQLLLLTCLILGLARPYVRRFGATPAGARHVFVLDTSASMEAREGHMTRFMEARVKALELLHSLQMRDEVMLVSAGRSPTVRLNFTSDHGVVADALKRIEPTDTGGNLSLALAFVDSTRRLDDVPTEVDVFTDVPASQLPPSVRQRVTVFQVGETDDNLGIEALEIFQGRFEDYRQARAYVLVQNFAHREGYGFLTLQLDDRVIDHSGFTIPPRASKGFLFDRFPGPGRVTARLQVSDALAADNVAYGWIRPSQPLRVLLVSTPSPLVGDLRNLAAAVPAIRLTTVAPATFTAAPRSADVVIFNGVVPDRAPIGNALYLYPPKDNRLFPVVGQATNVEVLDWNGRHPVLQGLRPITALPLERARIVVPPPWSQTLLWSRTQDREFPLALAGLTNGHRVACLTFDLAAERLLSSDNVNFFLFFLNLLGWLSPQSPTATVMRTGDVQALNGLPPGRVRLHDPRGHTTTLPEGQRMVQPMLAGAYRVTVDGTERMLFANFFDPHESDIGRARKEPPVYHEMANGGAASVVPRSEYDGWFYAAAAVLFLLEWIVARRVTA